jgi:hypothetical protein
MRWPLGGQDEDDPGCPAPCEVPGISTRTITGGNPDYLAWIAQETGKPKSDS